MGASGRRRLLVAHHITITLQVSSSAGAGGQEQEEQTSGEDPATTLKMEEVMDQLRQKDHQVVTSLNLPE